LISIGLLEGDSHDQTYEELLTAASRLSRRFRRARLWKRDFGYQIPAGLPRHSEALQISRRATIAKARNHLLFHALDDEDWVMWLDIDVVAYPPDLIERLLATGKDIVQPHCVTRVGGQTFDCNAWRDHGRLHMDDLRDEGELVELHAVGGTVLLVRADIHREGLVFPTFLYGRPSPLARPRGELETEGLGIMARDMGYKAWGMPHLEVIHRPW
jgi:peptide chain release factor subunit 1